MDLYEHQGKELFRAHGIPTPRGIVATSAEEAAEATRELGGESVVKVQVQVGGRGKGGGVVLVDSPERAAEEAARMLGTDFKGTASPRCSARNCCRSRRSSTRRSCSTAPPATTWR